MNKTIKGIIIGSVVTSLLLMQLPVLAETIEVAFNKIKVTVNGEPIYADNVLINGKTYVPLRAISEILNKDVVWDGTTSTAGINDKDYAEKQAAPGYSRAKPADIGTKLSVKFDNNKKEANIKIVELLRGDKAWDALKTIKYNEDYNKPKQGFDYILAKIEFELLESDTQYDLDGKFEFKLISQEGKEYEFSKAIEPKPELDTKLFKGAKHTGYITFDVEITDSKPIISFGKDYNGNGGVWFKTY